MRVETHQIEKNHDHDGGRQRCGSTGLPGATGSVRFGPSDQANAPNPAG